MKGLVNTPRDIARELARRYSTMTHDDEMILKEGDICKNIYFIDHGLIRQYYHKKGKEVTEHLGEDHTIFMCIESLFKEEPTRLQVEALEQTVVYAMPKQKLEQIALHNVNIQMMYRKILEESLIISQIHADLMRFESAQERYKKLCKQNPQVAMRAPLVYIANYLQMTPETLSRVRAASLYDD